MAIRVPHHDLVCTFSCSVLSFSPTEASLALNTINFSEPVIDLRNNVTRFVSVYSESTHTISVFTRTNGEGRILTIRRSGIRRRQQRCSRFHLTGSRLLCHLASSMAEVAFFTTPFPPVPLLATGHFVQARPNSGRSSLLKITLADIRLHALQPGPGQITHRSPLRYTLLGEDHNPQVAAGVLFTYVVEDVEFQIRGHQTVETTWGSIKVPRALAMILRVVYPTANYPHHMIELMTYLELADSGRIDGCHSSYLEALKEKNVDQIIEVVMVGIDFLSPPVLKRIYEIIGSKLDEFGQENFVESSGRLGFIVN